MPPPQLSSVAPEPDRVRLYANIVSCLETLLEGASLGDMFAQLRASGADETVSLGEDEDLQRMLRRIGLLPDDAHKPVSDKLTQEILRSMAESVSRTPAQVSLVFRLYASGLYGILPQPVCGSSPRCRICGVTRECAYYNTPKGRRPSHLSSLKRLEREEVDTISDEELLSLLLGGTRAGQSEGSVAKILQHYGSLRDLFAGSYGELMQLRDVTPSVAARIASASALFERLHLQRRGSRPAVRSGKDFFDLYYPILRDVKKERFIAVLLDQKHRIMRDEVVSEGSLTASIVHPREVFRPAIREAAAAIAFVHNHPSGDCTPSPEDRALTDRLVQTGELVGIRVLDHVVIGDGAYVSFVDEGLMRLR